MLPIAAYVGHHNIPVVRRGASIHRMDLVLADASSPFAEFATGGDGMMPFNIFHLTLDPPRPVEGLMTLPEAPGFGVRLNFDRLRPFA